MSCHIGAYPLRPSLLASLSESSFGFGSLGQVSHLLIMSIRVFGTAPLLISHVSITFLPISLSLSFRVGTAPISIDRSSYQFQFSSSRGRTYIDRPSSYQFEFEFSSWDRTYINRSFSFIVLVRVGAAPISINHHLVSLSLWVETAPISIGHSFCQFQFSSSWDCTYIDWSFIHLPISLSRGRTYIDRPFPCHISLVWVGTAPISIGHCLVS